ncbi:MAG: 5'-nucleotidase C-terminal domain-containing protein, partial [Chthonomonadaceae bacterium]|nr:5'-nucleotidase C-terminal domain-containing protein [Chthonomonadaceae bacterium]
ETELPRSGPGKQGVLADIITDAMLDATKAMGSTVALMNSGGIRSALNAGVISYGDAISVQPFNNTLVVLDLTGAELEETLSSGVLFVSQGSSFRLSNGKATEILISGQKLEPSKTYRCTFNSFVANGGDGLTVVKNATGKRTDTGLLDIDALIEYLKKNSPLKKKAEGRIK